MGLGHYDSVSSGFRVEELGGTGLLVGGQRLLEGFLVVSVVGKSGGLMVA